MELELVYRFQPIYLHFLFLMYLNNTVALISLAFLCIIGMTPICWLLLLCA